MRLSSTRAARGRAKCAALFSQEWRPSGTIFHLALFLTRARGASYASALARNSSAVVAAAGLRTGRYRFMPEAASEVGSTSGKYCLMKKLAAGDMGEICLAKQQGPAGFQK